MSDGGDRFDKLRELDEQSRKGEPSESASEEDEPNDAPEPTTDLPPREPSTSRERSTSPTETAERTRTREDPPFSFDDAKQRPLYARQKAWDAFEDALALEVERTLREYEVRNAEKRELHDAALRVAANHPDEIAALLLDGRGVDADL